MKISIGQDEIDSRTDAELGAWLRHKYADEALRQATKFYEFHLHTICDARSWMQKRVFRILVNSADSKRTISGARAMPVKSETIKEQLAYLETLEEYDMRELLRRYTERARLTGLCKKAVYRKLVEEYGEVCLACRATENLVIDHVKPISNGGTSDYDNLQLLCAKCNSKKHYAEDDYRKK